MPARLALAFALSVALHAVLLFAGADSRRAPPAPPRLEARLRLPPAPPAEPLLKNTLAAEPEPAKPAAKPLPPPASAAKTPAAAPKPTPARELRAAQKKLAQHQYYPPEAIAAGLEGEVRLLVLLDADGQISDVQIAASSGHRILDAAAQRAAFAMGSLPGSSRRELILPVAFRLR
ncbi:energy transducer TonB [Rhodocyclus tenuis]|uniref:Protein TonB n=1 Tax=Rhodocyclus tenuis TaxID=1066 RepID=A0A840GE04_RHOTE|nr:energy transducer TonB [Rhodocyclus tenuis]MBB4246459.1 protein TonB [Rhodocyclus tenuis]